ncbi:energy transducer TonB [Paraburkholderia fungorum]|uniref:energy transducer TonB n=1 Tax=Paraburkholderia fungorum TaxID=134537 RepID=UPI00048267FE|nr:energy transducer TonB [Paraburkholderia fungorum]MBB5541439.1 protein TonB [Paraburkholderia fungorum]PNE54587.1 energy transducer TonB [Paraburkholderia fungorum]
MTFLTMEGSGTPARRHAARWRGSAVQRFNAPAATQPQQQQRVPAVQHEVEREVELETRATHRTWGETGAAALLILALHAGFLLVARHGHDAPPAPVVPPRPLPMTVELTRPPVPLPQAKQAPPPVPQPLKQQAPPPRPLTRAAPKPSPAPLAPLVAAAPAPAPADTAVVHVPAPSAPVPAAPPAALAETAPIGNAAYLHNPAPDYPPIAQDQGWEGHVLLRVHVLANGKPDSVDIKTSSGRRMLDDAALAAVRHWIFVPAKRGDEAIDGWVNVPIDFKLG